MLRFLQNKEFGKRVAASLSECGTKIAELESVQSKKKLPKGGIERKKAKDITSFCIREMIQDNKQTGEAMKFRLR